MSQPAINDRKFYEGVWRAFRGELPYQLAIHLESRRPLLRLLLRHLPADAPSQFLEIGCGTALESCLLARERPQAAAWALDVSQQAVRIAQRHAAQMNVRLRALAADATAMPFADAQFDLVFSQGVLEHFADPAPAMRDQVRVLRPGGVLVVDVPQKFNLYTLQKRRAMRAGTWPWGWETEYSAAELRAWAPQYGLEVCGMAGYQHGRVVDRLLMHPHRTLRKLLARNGAQSSDGAHDSPPGNGNSGAVNPASSHGTAAPPANATVARGGGMAHAWESAWDWLDTRLGPYLAINVAVAFRKLQVRNQ